jgi:short-subunit dehydrogenase
MRMTRTKEIALGLAAAAGAGIGVLWARRSLRAPRVGLAGQVALVTGGSRGLGFLVAEELARLGCRLVICARDPEELERARRALSAGGAEVMAVPCDVARQDEVEVMVGRTLARFGRIDVLVNNAGTIQVAPLEALEAADFQQAMAISFWGTVHTTLAVLPYMRARRSGRIVNITSIGGKVAVPHLLPYDCAKFATVGFSEGLRAELSSDGVSVTTIVPGLMRTGSYRYAEFKGDRQGERRWFSVAARTPGLTMSARRAARQIVAAARRRQAERVLGMPAKLLRMVNAVLPAATARGLAVADQLLPDATAPAR